MKNAEKVTFGGSHLDRAGELRTDDAALHMLRRHENSRVIVLWRGKPLIKRDRPASLMRLPVDHPILQDAAADWILLGREDGNAVFAADISAWEPESDLSSINQFLDPSEQHHTAMGETEVFAELRRIMTWLTPRDAELAATAKAIFGWHDTHRFCAYCGAPTDMKEAGWQRTCGSCGRHHFPRTDPVVIMLITHGNSVLMGRSPGWPEGMYSLLAGFVEPGETLEAAVRREVFEESGVHVGQVDYLASQPWPFPASLMFGCKGEATSQELNIDPKEIEDAMWVSREEMADAFAGIHPKLKPARSGAIAHFLLENWLADTLD
ncbi:MAG: NAD(+) diphosphatase [Rhodobacteraceae bacterium]|nr:NAD(+) diphosphatase [Paracoccaceae bacterium]